MNKVLLFLLLSAHAVWGQYYPPVSIAAQNPSGQIVYVALDTSNNLFTNSAGSSTIASALFGYIPPMAMTGQNPSGQQVYLKTDANGNLYINCQTGCSGGASITLTTTGTSGAATYNSGTGALNIPVYTSGGSGNQSVTTITAGATPAITAGNGLWTITMNSDTAPTISGISAGQRMSFQICQPGAGGPYNWTWPAVIHGGMAQVTRNASQCSEQSFDSWSGTTLVAEDSGATNVAP